LIALDVNSWRPLSNDDPEFGERYYSIIADDYNSPGIQNS
jgi:hypothetical protein